MQHPTFDSDGYPTEETLQAIREWPSENLSGLFRFIGKAWKYSDYWEVEGPVIRAHTGGWSGNEDLIGALKRNPVIWAFCWQESKRGGHYVFEIPAYQLRKERESDAKTG